MRQHWSGLARLIGVLSVVAFLLLLEPDFGTTVIAIGMTVGMMFLAGARLLYVLMMVVTVAWPYDLGSQRTYRLRDSPPIKTLGGPLRLGFSAGSILDRIRPR